MYLTLGLQKKQTDDRPDLYTDSPSPALTLLHVYLETPTRIDTITNAWQQLLVNLWIVDFSFLFSCFPFGSWLVQNVQLKRLRFITKAFHYFCIEMISTLHALSADQGWGGGGGRTQLYMYPVCIRLMKVPINSIRITGTWVFQTGRAALL